jgi:sugar/nucleoside kinase (ribokinase family)
MERNGLFVGLSTLDFIYLTESIPKNNQKIVAIAQTIAAGGPATNAAVTFSHLGDRATLLNVLGQHSIADIIRRDLEAYKINFLDLDASLAEIPSVSSIMVAQTTGDRAVVSTNATKFPVNSDRIPPDILQNVEIVLIDGHQMQVSLAIAQQAKTQKIPIVVDCGSWKTGFEEVLSLADYVICSDDFQPPSCQGKQTIFAFLQALKIPHIAISQGKNPIQYISQGEKGEILISAIAAIDSLGAGDILHGAFCHYILRHDFVKSLALAAQIATYSCQFFGTRQWMVNRNKK